MNEKLIPAKYSPSHTEFTNRFNEILAIKPEMVKTKKAANKLLNKVADFIEFIENDEYFKPIVEKIYSNTKLLQTQEIVTIAANEVLAHVDKMYQKAISYKNKHKMTLPAWHDVLEAHLNKGVYTPTVTESLGSDLDKVYDVIYNRGGLPIREVDSLVSDITHTKFDFETLTGNHPYSKTQLDQLNQLFQDYKSKLKTYDELRRIVGVSDYSELLGIWESTKGKEISSNQVNVLVSGLMALAQSSDFKDSWYTLDEVREEVNDLLDRVKSVRNRINETITYGEFTTRKRLFRGAIRWGKGILRYLANKLPLPVKD